MHPTDISKIGFLNILKRGTFLEFGSEQLNFWLVTLILDAEPDGDGGIVLMLQGSSAEGELTITRAMIAGAVEDDDSWNISAGGILFRFDKLDSEPRDPGPAISEEDWDRVMGEIHQRDEERDARRREQEGR